MVRPNKEFRVRIQQEAIDELDGIYPKKILQTLRKKILSLRGLSRRGTRVKILEDQKLLKELRFLVHQEYLIFYMIADAEIIVLHITGHGQNWIDLFS